MTQHIEFFLACRDINLRLKKEQSVGLYEMISKPLGRKPLNIDFFFYRIQITHFVLIE